jgi:hypothetical protein
MDPFDKVRFTFLRAELTRTRLEKIALTREIQAPRISAAQKHHVDTTVMRRQCRNDDYRASTGRLHRRDQTHHGRKKDFLAPIHSIFISPALSSNSGSLWGLPRSKQVDFNRKWSNSSACSRTCLEKEPIDACFAFPSPIIPLMGLEVGGYHERMV